MVKENITIQMATSTMVNGKITRDKDGEDLLDLMVHLMKVNGKMKRGMDSDIKHFKLVKF